MLIAGGMSTGYDKPQTRAAESAAAYHRNRQRSQLESHRPLL